MDRITKRRDFLKAARARKSVVPGLVLQARRRLSALDTADETDTPAGAAMRVGFTATRKIGNAVSRNLAKRRLKEAARLTLPRHGRPGFDYVVIARARTAARRFDEIIADLKRALDEVHQGRHKGGKSTRSRGTARGRSPAQPD